MQTLMMMLADAPRYLTKQERKAQQTARRGGSLRDFLQRHTTKQAAQ